MLILKQILLASILVFLCVALHAQSPVLVPDFNPPGDDSFDGYEMHAQTLGDRIVMAIQSDEFGSEPAVVENDEIVLLKDINEGPESSNPTGFVKFNDKLYFSAFDETNGYGLWHTDGTTSGTELVFALGPEVRHRAEGLIVSDLGHLYFTSNSILYRTDGNGKEIMFEGVDFNETIEERSHNYALFDGEVAFVRLFNNRIEFYSVDGDSVVLGGTSLEIPVNGQFFGLNQVENGMIFGMRVIPFSSPYQRTYIFNRNTERVANIELANSNARRIQDFNTDLSLVWVEGEGYFITDGRPWTETKIVNSSNTSYLQGLPIHHATYNDHIAFVAQTGGFFGPQYIYISDGTAEGTHRRNEVRSSRSDMISRGSHAFIASGTSNGFTPELYHINMKEGSSSLLHTFNQPSLQLNSVQMVAIHQDRLYYTSNLDQSMGRKLYYMELDVLSSDLALGTQSPDLNAFITSHTYQLKSANTENYRFEIFDMAGRLLEEGIRSTNKDYSYSHLQGLHILRFTLNEKSLTKKVFSHH